MLEREGLARARPFFCRPHCDKGVPSPAGMTASKVAGVAAFPGGITKRVFGFDFGKRFRNATLTAGSFLVLCASLGLQYVGAKPSGQRPSCCGTDCSCCPGQARPLHGSGLGPEHGGCSYCDCATFDSATSLEQPGQHG